jgi:hypothetical protein
MPQVWFEPTAPLFWVGEDSVIYLVHVYIIRIELNEYKLWVSVLFLQYLFQNT